MELLSMNFINGGLKRYWRRRRYQRLDGTAAWTGRRNLKVVRFGGDKSGGSTRRFWRIRAIPKLRMKIFNPIKVLAKVRDAYVNMMVGWVGSDSFFGDKRIPRARQVERKSSKRVEEFEVKLIMEIYKSLKASRELAAFS
ncbi:hypothetical protein Syun_011136 [Stephania yunnanensis]|uniref:Uncharacterized protein n=1 Tax=Stephania yunnanensis TaxID=152371 RepID=A0AAP0JX79_9MAGN